MVEITQPNIEKAFDKRVFMIQNVNFIKTPGALTYCPLFNRITRVNRHGPLTFISGTSISTAASFLNTLVQHHDICFVSADHSLKRCQ